MRETIINQAGSPARVEPISPAGRMFLIACALVLVLLLTVGGGLAVWPLRQNQLAAVERHRGRMDPRAIEPGMTAADLTLNLALPLAASVGG